MYNIRNLTDNDDIDIIAELGPFKVIEYKRDLSVRPENAAVAYYSSLMNVNRRQVICDVAKAPITTQSGAMQWTIGNVEASTGVKGVGDMVGKAIMGKMSGEKTVKPEYRGNGLLILEPTFKHIVLINTGDWQNGIVLDDGLFLACDSRLQQRIVMRSNVSSALAGGEGLFNLCINGNGILCLESRCPRAELVEITLDNDTVKIDGNMAIAWSGSLQFTTERSSRSLIGSLATGDGLVNVYRGTGKILMAPVS